VHHPRRKIKKLKTEKASTYQVEAFSIPISEGVISWTLVWLDDAPFAIVHHESHRMVALCDTERKFTPSDKASRSQFDGEALGRG
jgi:hypothetical protein